MYVIDRLTFSRDETFRVPYFRIQAFNGKTLTLSAQVEYIQADLRGLDARAVAQATAIQPEGWELRGLIAVDSRLFATVMKQATTEGHAHQLGTVLDETWYWLSPMDLAFGSQRGKPVVVGLYR
jgi:hypothetical protein